MRVFDDIYNNPTDKIKDFVTLRDPWRAKNTQKRLSKIVGVGDLDDPFLSVDENVRLFMNTTSLNFVGEGINALP